MDQVSEESPVKATATAAAAAASLSYQLGESGSGGSLSAFAPPTTPATTTAASSTSSGIESVGTSHGENTSCRTGSGSSSSSAINPILATEARTRSFLVGNLGCQVSESVCGVHVPLCLSECMRATLFACPVLPQSNLSVAISRSA